jgi:hypothetical protein
VFIHVQLKWGTFLPNNRTGSPSMKMTKQTLVGLDKRVSSVYLLLK